MPVHDYYELFDETQAGILGALETAVTEAHAWDFLRYWDVDWEMVPLPSIENRLPNRDAYDEDLYRECVDIIWTIARVGWYEFRDSYIEVNPPCTCRQRAGRIAGYCWPRNNDEDVQPMCEEIRNYGLIVHDNEQISRLNHLDNIITEQGDWEFWANDAVDGWRMRAHSYGVEGVTLEDMQIISAVATLGFDEYLRTRPPQVPEVD